MATNLPEKYQFCTMKSKKIVECCRIPKQAGWGYKWPTLTELHSHLFETGFAGSHDAHADVEACARCFFELRKRGII